MRLTPSTPFHVFAPKSVEGIFAVIIVMGWWGLLLAFGPTFGVMFSALLAGVVLFVAWSYRLERGGRGGNWPRRLRRLIYWGGSVWLLTFGCVALLMFGEPDGPIPPETSHLLVLGAGLKDGDHLSEILKSRLDRTLELARTSPALKIIVSGGRGSNERLSEAAAMRRYLVLQGIQAERIQEENRSTSTRENILFSRQLLQQQGALPANIVLLTSDFHLYRARKLAAQAGLVTTGVQAATPFWVLLNYSVREYFAIVKDVFVPWVQTKTPA